MRPISATSVEIWVSDPENRCHLCRGVLVSVATLPPRDWLFLEIPAYVCNIVINRFGGAGIRKNSSA